LTIGSLRRAVQEGDKDNGSFMCGQIGGMVNELRPCKTIIETMFAQAEDLLKNRYKDLY
jgi:enoyl-[acyl-carrier protein] reductase II